MKVVLWNVRSGGVGRLPALAASLTAQDADVVVLNEYRADGSAPLIGDLRERGWQHTALSAPPAGFGGVAVCSRLPLIPRATPADLGEMAHRSVVVAVGEEAGLVLWAVYAPYAGPDVARFWHAVLDGLTADQGRDVVLLGDLNAGVPGSDIPEQGLPGAQFVRSLSEAGLQDLWRLQHGDDAREYSWQGTKHPYRIDHAFGSPSAVARLRGCRYVHDGREAGTSDHSLLVLELTPRPATAVGELQAGPSRSSVNP